MTLGAFHNALNGGTKWEEVEIFTEEEEARKAERARLRARRVNEFSSEEVLRADRLVLLDSEGGVIHEIPFCPE
jgi:hypothetical protein